MSRRLRRSLVALALLGALALIAFWRSAAPHHPGPSESTLERVAVSSAWPVTRPRAQNAQREPARSAPQEVPSTSRMAVGATLIADVKLEPASVCAGDEVKVRAELLPRARDAKLFVDGHAGEERWIRARAVGPQTVRVLARSWGEEYELREVTLEVRPCIAAAPSASLRMRLTAPHEYGFALEPAPAGSVRWEFGDGTSAQADATALHRYPLRTDRTHSTYLISATYEGARGQEVARIAVTHAEPLAIAARTRFPILSNEGPRFVKWEAQHGLHTARSIDNPLRVPVTFKLVELRGSPCDGSAPIARVVAAEELLDQTMLSAGKSALVDIQIPGSTFKRPVCQVFARLFGDADGRVASTNVALETGLPERTEPLERGLRRELKQLLALRTQQGPVTSDEIERFRIRSGSAWRARESQLGASANEP